MIDVYTDGACKGNPGPGGWGVAFYKDGELIEHMHSGEACTTNNRMELQAFISALAYIEDRGFLREDSITIYIDSQYVIKGTTEWMDGWKSKNFLKVKNEDMWREIDSFRDIWLNLSIVHVKGHSGNVGNDKADELANRGALPFLG